MSHLSLINDIIEFFRIYRDYMVIYDLARACPLPVGKLFRSISQLFGMLKSHLVWVCVNQV